jgi:hypothetical protein
MLGPQASAIAIGDDELLFTAGERLVESELDGRTRGERTVRPGVTAILPTAGTIVLGFRDGSVDLVPRAPGAVRMAVELEDLPPSTITRLAEGPQGTLFVGFADGLTGLWQLDTGARLDAIRVHGAVFRLIHRGAKLRVVSTLGDDATLDLTAFEQTYCDLMRDVWRSTPVEWEGVPRRRGVPADHPCAARR